jgi:hypothetical protein
MGCADWESFALAASINIITATIRSIVNISYQPIATVKRA